MACSCVFVETWISFPNSCRCRGAASHCHQKCKSVTSFSPTFPLLLCRWQSHSNLCCLCQCTKFGALTYHDARVNAAWTNTPWTPSGWRRWSGRSCCPLFDKGLTAVNIFPDYMHVKFLGWLQYCMGSVLWLLCYQILPDSALQNLHACCTFVKQHQKQNKHLVVQEIKTKSRCRCWCFLMGIPFFGNNIMSIPSLKRMFYCRKGLLMKRFTAEVLQTRWHIYIEEKCVCKAIKATFSIFSASLKSFLRQRICQFAWKKLSIFVRKKDYPKLRGRAADLKGLGPAMLALWLHHTRHSAEARFALFAQHHKNFHKVEPIENVILWCI